jgi:hypothetical protein
MVTYRGVAGGVVVCAVLSVVLAGCGSDSADSTSAATPGNVAASSTTTAPAPPTQAGVTPPDSTVSSPLAGGAQQVSGDGWTATITVGDHLTRSKGFSFSGLLAPVTIDVTSGAALAAPSYWKVHTLSGKTLAGSSSGSIPTAIGDRPLDRDAAGLIPFPSYTTTDLTDDVAITEVALYAAPTDRDPIARWELPKPLAVKDIPAAGE